MAFIKGIEGLRAIAALMVLVFHFYVFSGFSLDSPFAFLVQAGWTGVDVFFTISGFVLFLPVGRAWMNNQNIKLGYYYKKRLLRVVPAYYFNILAIVVLVAPAFIIHWSTFKSVILTMFFVQGFVAERIPTVNGVMWTLCLEIQFYILLPFIYKFFVGRRWKWGLIGALLLSWTYESLAIKYALPQSLQYLQYLFRQLPAVIDEFAIGMAAASLWLRYQKTSIRINYFGAIGIVLFISCMKYITMFEPSVYWYGKSGLGFIPLLTSKNILNASTALLIIGICFGGTISKIFESKVITYLGSISYGIYLWHHPIGGAIQAKIKEPGIDKFITLLILGGITTIIWASISYFFVEKQFLKLKDKPLLKTSSELFHRISKFKLRGET